MNNIYENIYDDYLMHHGVKGMKWGVRRYSNRNGYLSNKRRKHKNNSSRLRANDSDSSVTKRVKKDYNSLSDEDFARKYSCSKQKYFKRVEKYGDPYMNAPLAKIGKKLPKNVKISENQQKRINKILNKVKNKSVQSQDERILSGQKALEDYALQFNKDPNELELVDHGFMIEIRNKDPKKRRY